MVPIFLCGAPRSGTTLLHNLFDGTDEYLSIPVENQLIDKYYYWKSIDESFLPIYFMRHYEDSIDNRILFEQGNSLYFKDRRKKRFKVKDAPVFGSSKEEVSNFFTTFVNELKADTKNYCLEHFLNAYITAFKTLFGNSNQQPFVILRRNLFNEFFALTLKEKYPDAKFIHIVRDPRTRYLSCKARALRRGITPSSRIRNKHKMNFTIYTHTVSSLSYRLAIKNKRIIGKDYCIIKFEDLASSRDPSMRRICTNLDLPYEKGMQLQTQYGEIVSPNSSHDDKDFEHKLKKDFDRYIHTTSRKEKAFCQMILADSAKKLGYELDDSSKLSFLNTITPFRYEDIRDYNSNRYQCYSLWRSRLHSNMLNEEKLIKQLIKGIELGI